MILESSRLYLGLIIVGALHLACGSKPTPYVQSTAPKATKAPCWIKKKDCLRQTPDDDALYFVGQSAKPIANWGHPTQESLQSAQLDAEHQYARFLGVEIESSLFLQDVFSEGDDHTAMSQQVSSTVNRKVSDVRRVAEYALPVLKTEDGEPVWTVYLLIKIDAEAVERHRKAIAKESQQMSSPKGYGDQWVVELSNIDDFAFVVVNGVRVTRCGFSRSCSVQLARHLKPGKNKVSINFGNRVGVWTYGYEVKKNGKLMYDGRCGQVWVYGCEWDMTTGVRHTFDFTIDYRGS